VLGVALLCALALATFDAADPVLQQTLSELDPELAAMFRPMAGGSAPQRPTMGPPKSEEPEPEDLLVELIED